MNMRLTVSDGKACLSIRDTGRLFDPRRWYAANTVTTPYRGMGIKMIIKSAETIEYASTFKLNFLLIKI